MLASNNKIIISKDYIPEGETLPLLDPRRDVVFKTIFTRDCEESRIALRSLLSAFTGKTVTETQIVENCIPIQNVHEKVISVDVNCRFNDGHYADIEMQMYNTFDSLPNRMLYYVTSIFAAQPLKGMKYDELKEVYQILICDATIFPKRKEFLHDVCFRFEDGQVFNKNLSIKILELAKAEKMKYTKASECVKHWGEFFRNAGQKTPDSQKLLDRICTVDRGINMATSVLSKISDDEMERLRILSETKAINDYNVRMRQALDHGVEQGLKEGLELGKKEGIERGKKEGLELGKKEGLELGKKEGLELGIEKGRKEEHIRYAQETARNLKKMNIPAEQISQAIGLSVAEINAL